MKAKFSLDGRRRRDSVEPEPRAQPIEPKGRWGRWEWLSVRIFNVAFVGVLVFLLIGGVWLAGSDMGWFTSKSESPAEPLRCTGDDEMLVLNAGKQECRQHDYYPLSSDDTNTIITDSDESIFTYSTSEPSNFPYRESILVAPYVDDLPAKCTPGRLYVVRFGSDKPNCSVGTGNRQLLCMCDKGGRSYSAWAMVDE